MFKTVKKMSSVISTMSVLTLDGFPFEDIQMSELEKRDRKYYIDYSIDGQPVFFQVNHVTLTGPTLCANETQCYLDVCIKDKFSHQVKDFFQEMDNFNKVSCFTNSEEWLGKHISMQDIDTVYRSAMTQQVLRVKIEKGALCTFDYKKNKIAFEGLEQGHVLDIIVELAGLKIMKNAFSANLILRQIRKHPETMPKIKAIPSEYLFLDKRHGGGGDESLDSQTDIGTPMFSTSINEKKNNDIEDHENKNENNNHGGGADGHGHEDDEDTQTEKYVKNVETLKSLMAEYISSSSVASSSVAASAASNKPKKARKKGGSEDTTNTNNNNMAVTPTILGSLLGETVVSATATAPTATKKPATPRKRAAPAAKKAAAAAAAGTPTEPDAAITALTAQLYKNI
jgi:hypothetical protein